LLTDARSVVVYFIPFAKDIPRGNRHDRHASKEWARAYIETNRLIEAVNRCLARHLAQKGYRSALLPPTHNFDEDRLVSDWSHKHVAYIAGLGKFGVHHLLITAKGCCGRLGSLVTNFEQPASPRPDGEFCLNRFNGSCLKCVAKCVAGALKPRSLDRRRCYRMLLENAALYSGTELADVCGKCTCIVPCSFHNPVARANLRRSEPSEHAREKR
jgi:epoxyqueuosine reductase QueG